MAVDPALNVLTERVIGAAIEVHRHLGAGFLETTYEKAMAIEMRRSGLAFELQKSVELQYKGESLGEAESIFLWKAD